VFSMLMIKIVIMYVQDRVVADARGRGAQTDNLHDFNPFANDHASTRVCIMLSLYWVCQKI